MSNTNVIDKPPRPEHFDVLIVGAGISGIGGAYHPQERCKDKNYLILENQESFAGTWLTHKYPGIRSDSDLYTFGYSFKPWTGVPIATAESILEYMNEVIEENGTDKNIRYQHQIKTAKWSSENQQWTLESIRKDTGERDEIPSDKFDNRALVFERSEADKLKKLA